MPAKICTMSPAVRACRRCPISLQSTEYKALPASLDDPNFSSLRRWMRAELSLSDYKHYRLVREPDIAAVRHAPEERIEVVSYGPNYHDLAPFLAALRSGVAARGMRGLDATPHSAPYAKSSPKSRRSPPTRTRPPPRLPPEAETG